MANIFLILEGQSEELFYKNTFSNYYSNKHLFNVVIMPTKKNNYSNTHRGGDITYDTCLSNIKHFLSGTTHCEKVILIYDYYALNKSFKVHLTGLENTIDKKVKSIQDRLEKEINNPKFKFILQVHEFEAFLFSDINKVVEHYNAENKLIELKRILQAAQDNPELINDSETTAPSKRLIVHFPSYKFGKTTDGVIIAQKIGVERIREKCNHFDLFCKLLD